MPSIRRIRPAVAALVLPALVAALLVSSSATASSAALVSISPGTNIQAVLNANPAGTTFRLEAGVHRRQRLNVKNDTTLLGANGAILDGGGIDGPAIAGHSARVTIDNLEIRNYDASIQESAVQATHPQDPNRVGVNWTVRNSYVHNNGARGITVGEAMKVINSRITNNGQLGIGGREVSGVRITGNEIAGNNTRNFDSGWEAGGVKISGATGLVIADNHIHDNDGPGVWCDGGCNGIVIEDNLIEDHFSKNGAAIFSEISSNVRIESNTIKRCGRNNTAWLWGAGVQIAASNHVDIIDNSIIGCDVGVGLIQQDRTFRGQVRRLDNVVVRDNSIVNSRSGFQARSGVATDTGNSGVFNRSFTFTGNTYSGDFLFLWDHDRHSLADWRAFGFDVPAPSGGGSTVKVLSPTGGGRAQLLIGGVVVDTFSFPATGRAHLLTSHQHTTTVERRDVKVKLLDGDGKFRLDAIVIDGTRYEARDFWSTGTWCGASGWFRVETLRCNRGSFDFGRPTPPLATIALGSSPPECDGRKATIRGTSGKDTIVGTPGNDVIWAGGGNDAIFGGAGNDIICGGDGFDSISGGAGADRVFAGDGKDAILSEWGNDTVYSGGGDDYVHLGDGADFGHAGGGSDTIRGGTGQDTLRGGAGIDDLAGNGGVDNCNGGGQIADTISGC